MKESTGQNNLTSESRPKTFWDRDRWNRRTKLERTLLLITVTSLLLVSIMAVTLAVFGYLYQKNIDSRQELNPICLTPGCVRTAAEILLNTDESIDPCEDFYEFACGGWINRQTIPEDKSSTSVLTKMIDDIKRRLKVSLETLTDSEPEFIKMLKRMYNSCMDLKSIETYGADPLKNALKSLGGWPVVEGRKWRERYFNWIDTLKAIRKLGYSHDILIDLSVRPDRKNDSFHVINLNLPELGIPDPSSFLNGLNDSTISAYFEMMVKSAMLLGVDETTSRAELLKALQFETALANISMPDGERRNDNASDQSYTIEKLQQEFPKIPWLKYFDSLLNDKVYENETVIVHKPDFIRKFVELITSSEKRVVSNYMIWRVIQQALSLLSKEWRDLAQENEFIVTGKREDEPRWMQCLGSLETHLRLALVSFKMRHHFKEEFKDSFLELAKYIKMEFINILEEVDWMDEKTKKQLQQMFRIMKIDLGYHKELLNNTAMTEYYKNLKITNESYFENVMSYKKWDTDNDISQLRKPYLRGEWINQPIGDDAFFSFGGKFVGFSPVILEPPLFEKDSPQYLNFGGMGSIIGSMFTGGFGYMEGDKDGNNINSSGETTGERFRKKAQCFIDQYSDNTENVRAVIGENGALKDAYWAYRSWVKDHGNDQLLPGLKYTQNQMFWISAASHSCEKKRPEVNKLNTVLDDYKRSRVNGPMSNLPEFSKDFTCPSDSPMNKKEKCQVW